MYEVSLKKQNNVRKIRSIYLQVKKALQKSGQAIVTNFTDRLFWKYEVKKNISFFVSSYQEIKTAINCSLVYDTLVVQEN